MRAKNRKKLPQSAGYLSIIAWRRVSSGLEDPLRPLQIAEGTDVCHAEGEAVKVLVSRRAWCKPAVFKGHTTAVPIVRRLEDRILQDIEWLLCIRIQYKVHGSINTPPARISVPREDMELIKP